MEENTLAQTLVHLRKKREMTQKELASKLNYSDKVISKWERGETLPDINALKGIARFYNVSLDALVEDAPLKESSDVRKPTANTYEPRHIKGPSRFLVWSLLPFTLLFLGTLLGPIDLFIMGSFIYAFILFTYSMVMAYNTWRLDYMGHVFIIRNKPLKATLEMDGIITDQSDAIFSRGLKLVGSVEGRTLKVYISSLLRMKCSVIID